MLVSITTIALSGALLGASHKPPRHAVDPSARDSGATTVTVLNQEPRPVTLYLEHGAFDLPLGTVAPHDTTTFEVPRWLVLDRREVDFFAMPKGRPEQSTGPMTLVPGEHLGIRVPER
ncbi:MAG: hypothetical protein R2909_05935 [Gemmatimonadales bacterium]